MSVDPAETTSSTHIKSTQTTTNSFNTSAQHVSASTNESKTSSQDSLTKSKGKSRQVDQQEHDEPVVIRITEANASPRITDNEGSDAAVQSRVNVAGIAPELLMRICSFLDPVSLARSAAVCRPWAMVARDDATWRSAFAVYFGLEAATAARAVGSHTSQATPALRRLVSSSWRQEFQQRVDLLRIWRKSRTPTVLSMPRVDIISKISLSKQHKFLLSASDMYGVASRSNPWTGKVTKGYLDAEGMANGAGNGNPNVEFSPNVTCLNASADATNVFWGFGTGDISMTSLARQGINPRGAIKSHLFSARACHAGAVTAIAIPFASDSDGAHGPGRSPERLRRAIAALGDVSTTFVTAGNDGTVRLWSSLRAWPLWIAATSSVAPNAMSTTSTQQNAARPAAPIRALAYDARHGVIVAGNSTGQIFVWSQLDVAALLRIPPEATDPEHARDTEAHIVEAQAAFQRLEDGIFAHVVDHPQGTGTETAVASIHIDAALEETKLLVHYSNARVLLRHHIMYAERKVETTLLGAAIMDEITALRADFQPWMAKKEDRSPNAQTPSASAVSSPSLIPSRDVNLPDAPRLVLGPSPFDTYSGEGQYPERKYVCVGTRSGSIFLFDWDAAGAPYDPIAQQDWQGSIPARLEGSTQLLPSLGWEAHHTPITALDMTPLYILIGASDGTIKVFDALAGDLIRTINDRTATRHPARMLAAGELTDLEAARFRVTQIIADNECLVASIGHQVLAFRAEPVLSKRAAAAAAAASAHKARGGRARLSDSKYALQVELKRDVRESKVQLEAENEERQAEYDKYRSRGQDVSRPAYQLEGLSEAEALEYALMLSRDEEAAQATHEAQYMGGDGYVPGSHASSSAARIEPPAEHPVDDPDLADALEQIALAESKAEAEAQVRSSAYHQAFTTNSAYSYASPSARRGKGKLLDDPDFENADPLESEWELDFDSDGLVRSQSNSHSNTHPSSSSSRSLSPSASPSLTAMGVVDSGRTLSPSSSLSTSASRAWTILAQARGVTSSPARSIDRWGQHSKVRTVQVPASARISSPPLSPIHPCGSSLSSSAATASGGGDRLGPPELASPTDFPAITPLSLSPHAASPSPAAWGKAPQMSRRSSSTTSTDSPGTKLGRWKRSPVLQPTSAAQQTRTPPTAWKLRSPQSTPPPSGSVLGENALQPQQPKTSLLAAALRPPLASASHSALHIHPSTATTTPPTHTPADAEDRDLLLAIQRSLADQHSTPHNP